jgi:hypothetical protein
MEISLGVREPRERCGRGSRQAIDEEAQEDERNANSYRAGKTTERGRDKSA